MRLIINGDDFGLTRGCNLGLVDSFRRGVMTSTSLMVNMPAAEDAAGLWRENRDMSVGLHLNITAGFPLGEGYKTLLRPDGRFDKGNRHKAGRVDPDEIRREYELQYRKFLELTGRKPDHLNSHHWIETLPETMDLIQELSIEKDVPMRQFIMLPHPERVEYRVHYPVPQARAEDTPSGKVEKLAALFTKEELASDGVFELVVHPGYVDAELLEISSLTTGRCLDMRCLCGEEMRKWIRENRVELIDYRDLPRC